MYIETGKPTKTTPVDTTSVSPGDLSSGKPIRVKCIGLSMYPLIKYNDILVIQPVKTKELSTGEVVYFKSSAGLSIVHRLIRKTRRNTLLTNGDSLRKLDKPVRKDRVLGKVVKIIRNGKTLEMEGTINKIISWLIIQLAQFRIPLQITLKQNLARIQWLLCGKSIA